MSALVLLCVGSLKHSEYQALQDFYLKKIKPYCRFEIIEVKDSKQTASSVKNKEEAANLLKKISLDDVVVLIDLAGKQMTSENFSKKIQSYYLSSKKKIVFVIGGAFGFDESLIARATDRISLSDLTYNHELARVVFLEQLYRAHTILKGEKYHH